MRPMVRTIVFALLPIACFFAGCGQDGTSSGRVGFIHPDQIDQPGVQDASDAVVKLELYSHNGTGFFISGTGYLLSNHHVAGWEVCAEECPGLRVIAFQQRGREQVVYRGARLIFSDQDLDMALLKVDVGSDRVDFIRLSDLDPDDPVDREWLVSLVGHPFSTIKKATRGIIDFRSGEEYFIEAFVFPGNSGSPLLSPTGEAIGLVKAIYFWIEDIDRKGQYGDSGMATTMARILEKYPFLEGLNADVPSDAALAQLTAAVDAMEDGRPETVGDSMGVDVDNLVRGNIDAALSRIAHLDEELAFEKTTEIWGRVADREIFEEFHRHDAARALFALADSPEQVQTVFDLLSAHVANVDWSWENSYLWLINRLGTDQAVDFSQTGISTHYAGYQVSPVLAAILLAYGIRAMNSVDLLRVCERLFKDSTDERFHYLVAYYLDAIRFQSQADEDRAVGVLEKIRDRTGRVKAVFYAEQALYNRGLIDLR